VRRLIPKYRRYHRPIVRLPNFCSDDSRRPTSVGNVTTRNRRRNVKMVLTSHDVLGNTGLKTGFGFEEFAAPYFVFRDAGVPADPRLTERWATTPRSEERFTSKPNTCPDPVQVKTRRHRSHFPRRSSLPTSNRKITTRSSMWAAGTALCGTSQKAPFHRSARGLLQFRKADRSGLPFSRRASSRDLPGRAAREGKTRDRFYRWRSGRDAADPRCPISRRG
jgi:hypothetical protein